MNHEKLKSLFLSQSYSDCYDDYVSLGANARWDFVVITASNAEQAANYSAQILERQQNDFLPKSTKFIVVPDILGMRIGSGGATLNVLKVLSEEYGVTDYKKYKVLLIHSGGDSKRIPQFSACGKLFSPVPRVLRNGRASTIFDEFMITTASIPSRIKCGMLVMSGDVLLLFNPLQIDFDGAGAMALSIKADAETGVNHGVFLGDSEGRVEEFLHKKSLTELTKKGASQNGMVDIDTGAILLGENLLAAMYSLIADKKSEKNIDKAKFEYFVNDKVRLNFYGDMVFLLTQKASLKNYLEEESEGLASYELVKCRREIWDKLSQFKMKLNRLYPSDFIHFGTTHEYLELCSEEIDNYSNLGWSKNVLANVEDENCFLYNSFIDNSKIGKKSLIENSMLSNCVVGEQSIVSNTNLSGQMLPSGVVVHTIVTLRGEYVTRIYGIDDNPKIAFCKQFLSADVSNIFTQYGIDKSKLFDTKDDSLWNANIFVPCKTQDESVREALKVFKIFKGNATKDEVFGWLGSKRMSLAKSFCEADMVSQISINEKLTNKIIASLAVKSAKTYKNFQVFRELLVNYSVSETIIKEIKDLAERLDSLEKSRIYHYLAKLLKGTKLDIPESRGYEIIRETYKKDLSCSKRDFKFAKDEYRCELPVRVNFGGGWTDTPPYCLEKGGTVLNCAIKLEGRFPIKITAKKLEKKVIVLECLDVGIKKEFSSVEEILSCSDPNDTFALHKACLVATGIVREKTSLLKILDKLGGGLYLSSDVIGIPRGSGLGTSSILAGGCVKAVFNILGYKYDECEIYDTVLLMEQIMSTGGGWQDQVGGLSGGVKMITSSKGFRQKLKIEKVIIPQEKQKELNERFALIYTGQRRLARNLLRKVMGGYLEGNQSSTSALEKIKRYALKMKNALEAGNIDEFALLLGEHWKESKKLDAGSSNTCIDFIFDSCEHLLQGKMICGAGGGGFLQVILKKGVTKEELSNCLSKTFASSNVLVYDSEILFD